MTSFDLVIRNGKVVTAADVFSADIGIVSGQIVALAAHLDGGKEEIDAAGRTITPAAERAGAALAGMINGATAEVVELPRAKR